jgi:hypothetical protein
MDLSYEQRRTARREELAAYLAAPINIPVASPRRPDSAFEAARLEAIEAARAARTILPGQPVTEAFSFETLYGTEAGCDRLYKVWTTEHDTAVPDNPYEHRPLAWRVGEGESARWIELADFAAGRPLVEATVDIEAQERASDLDAWEDATWLDCNPQARTAEPLTELHPVLISVLVPDDSLIDWDVATEDDSFYRYVEVEVFTETGCSPWDVDQWEIDHAPSDGLDARSALLTSECVTVTEPLDVTIPDDDGVAHAVTYHIPTRQHTVAVQGCYAALRKARLAARKTLDDTLVAQIAAKNRRLLVDTLVEYGFDPKHPDTVRWVEDFKRRARGKDGLAYARALDDLTRRHAAQVAVPA